MIETRELERIIAMALEEDMPHGDITSQMFIPAEAAATAEMNAREPGVFSGGQVIEAVMHAVDPATTVKVLLDEGARFESGQVLAHISGNARAILAGERIALNLVQRMSAIATLTADYVAAAGPDVRVVDTRKTTPGLRALERHAVVCGGGKNHRYSLSDAVMAKDNHLALIDDITAAIRSARAHLPHTTHIEIEVDRIDQLEAVLAGEPDTIMLDNFTLEELREGVALINGQAIVEASGGVSLDTIGAIAQTGVDVISVGALTHGVTNLDLGLDVVIRKVST